MTCTSFGTVACPIIICFEVLKDDTSVTLTGLRVGDFGASGLRCGVLVLARFLPWHY
jgi:hypothetical protein